MRYTLKPHFPDFFITFLFLFEVCLKRLNHRVFFMSREMWLCKLGTKKQTCQGPRILREIVGKCIYMGIWFKDEKNNHWTHIRRSLLEPIQVNINLKHASALFTWKIIAEGGRPQRAVGLGRSPVAPSGHPAIHSLAYLCNCILSFWVCCISFLNWS